MQGWPAYPSPPQMLVRRLPPPPPVVCWVEWVGQGSREGNGEPSGWLVYNIKLSSLCIRVSSLKYD